MARKKKTSPPNEPKRGQDKSVKIAVIGLIGVLASAVLGLVGTLVQVNRPISASQTAQSLSSSIPTDTDYVSESTLVSESTPPGSQEWTDLFNIYLGVVCESAKIARGDLDSRLSPSKETTVMFSDSEQKEISGWDLFGNYKLLYIGVESKLAGSERLRIGNQFSLQISAQDAPDEHLQILGQSLSCGGQGFRQTTYESAPVEFSNEFSNYGLVLPFSEADFYTFETGEFELFAFDTVCKNPGIYTIRVDIPFAYQGQESVLSWVSSRKVICPNSYSFWSNNLPEMALYEADYEWVDSELGGYYERIP